MLTCNVVHLRVEKQFSKKVAHNNCDNLSLCLRTNDTGLIKYCRRAHKVFKGKAIETDIAEK